MKILTWLSFDNVPVFYQVLCCYLRFEFEVNFNISGLQRNSSRTQNYVKSCLKKFFFFFFS